MKLSLADRVANYNTVFADRFPPMTYWAHPKTKDVLQEWIIGNWYCGTAFQKAVYYGMFPSTYHDRIHKGLFPDISKYKTIELCSGTLPSINDPKGTGFTVDIKPEPVKGIKPDFIINAENISKVVDTPIDLVCYDRPYNQFHAQKGYSLPLVSTNKVMKELEKILSNNGFFVGLDISYPSYQRSRGWRLCGDIGVTTGFCKVKRMVYIFQFNRDWIKK